MWSFRKEVYKKTIGGKLGTDIQCDKPLSVRGTVGVYHINANLANSAGRVWLNYEAFNIPDRFVVEYDGNIVLDTKYVGDNLGSLPTGTYNLPVKEYDGFQFLPSGVSEAVAVGPSDKADDSPGYPSAGLGSAWFVKPSNNSPTNALIKIYAPSGSTAWDLTISCPEEVPLSNLNVLSIASDACYTCGRFEVVVPPNTKKRVIVQSGGDLPLYIENGGDLSCANGTDVLIFNDADITIDQTTVFSFGLKGQSIPGPATNTSNITIKVYDAFRENDLPLPPIATPDNLREERSYTLARSHESDTCVV